MLAVSVLIWSCILESESISMSQEHFRGIVLDEPNYPNLLQVYGMITFQFDIHPMLMTIEVDMTQKHKIGKVVCYGLLGKNTQSCTMHTSNKNCILLLILSYMLVVNHYNDIDGI